jgi:serine/threonine-protein kinase RsbW
MRRDEPGAANGTGVVSLTVPARPEFIALGRLALTGLARTRALSPDLLADMKLALTEACSNSVRHAYEEGREGAVEIRYELDDTRLVVEVADDGDGFDPEVLQAVIREREEGGLGIAIIRAVTDELAIGPGPRGQGSRLRFVKYFE